MMTENKIQNDGVKMDESLTERQQIHKLEEDIRHLLARYRKAEAMVMTIRKLRQKLENAQQEIEKSKGEVAALTARAEKAEADVKQCQEVYAAARALFRIEWQVDAHGDFIEDADAAVARLAKAVGR